MKIYNMVLLLAVACSLMGCNTNNNELSARELASATGVMWWCLKIPAGHEKDFLNISFLRGKKSVPSSGGCTGWKAGEEVKVFLFETTKEKLSYSIVGKKTMLRGSIPNKFRNYKSPSSLKTIGSTIELGDILIKRSVTNSVSDVINPLKDGEIGITVTFSND